MSNINNKPATSESGLYRGALHNDPVTGASLGGIQSIVDGIKKVEIEGEEYHICRDAMESSEVFKFENKTNKQILEKLFREEGCVFTQGKSDSGDFIVCRLVVLDDKKRTIEGTPKRILNMLQQEKACRMTSDSTINKLGGVFKEVTEEEISARWTKKRESIETLSNNIQKLRYNISTDLKSENEKIFLTALAVSIMDKTAERVGNSVSAKAGHFGISGFKKTHVAIIGNKVHLEYVGKSGVEHTKSFSDEKIAKLLKKAIKNSPSKLVFTTSDGFQIKADRINRYLSDFGVSAKDIRGYSANRWMIDKLKKQDIPKKESDRKKLYLKTLRQVAEKVGHGFATLRKHYVIPELETKYVSGSEIIDISDRATYEEGGEVGCGCKHEQGGEVELCNKLYEDHHEVWDELDVIEKDVCDKTCKKYSKKISAMWEAELKEHFMEEEDYLFPTLPEEKSKIVSELLAEHKDILSLIKKIEKENKETDILKFCKLMKSHIKKEEGLMSVVTPDPFKDGGNINVNEIEEAIEGMRVMLEMANESDKQNIEDYIAGLEFMRESNKKEIPMNQYIDELVEGLQTKYLNHSAELKKKTELNDLNSKRLISEIDLAISSKEKGLALVKINSEKSKNELLIKREIKQKAIKEQDESGVKDKIIRWVKEPENNVKIIIAFSGGKDSVAVVLSALEMGFDKNNIELWHHEVDGKDAGLFDWKCTKSYCQAFADAFGLPILFSYAEGGIEREIFRKNETLQPVYFQQEAGGEFFVVNPQPMRTKDTTGEEISKEELAEKNTKYKFPAVSASLTTRWCSGVAKIDVMKKAINNSERFNNANIIILTGERREESTARSLYIEFEKHGSYTIKRKVISWRSIVAWSEKQVWAIMEKHLVQAHPCYELGWGRCSCQLCIFSSANHWASINEINPEKIKRVAQIEKEIGHTLYNEHEKIEDGATKDGKIKYKKSKIKLNIYGAKVEKGKSFLQELSKKRWEKEANGEFVSPIFVKEWKIPVGAFDGENCGAN